MPNYKEWEPLITGFDYVFAMQSGVNRYYVDKSRPEMIKRFADLKREGIDRLYRIAFWNNDIDFKGMRKRYQVVENIKKMKILYPVKILKRRIQSLMRVANHKKMV